MISPADFKLLKQLCSIHAPSGSEAPLSKFILQYAKENQKYWAQKPVILAGDGFMDAVIMVFGKPRTALFAHMDSVGFTVRYGNELVPIGSPRPHDGAYLASLLNGKSVTGRLKAADENSLYLQCDADTVPGTTFTFKSDFRAGDEYIQCCSLDNRIGVFNALKQAESLQNGALVFSCWEETGGGSVAWLARYIYVTYNIRQALISDVTWVTDGIEHGKGVVISRRDSGIPRQSYIDHIISLAQKSKLPFQIEVEKSGGSDGNVIHRSPYPIDWCFIGPPEDYVHSPDEKVHIADLDNTVKLYRFLMEHL